jgi:predicted metal-dependent peptidase
MPPNLTDILVNILLEEPFFGHLASKLMRQESDQVPDTGLILEAGGTIALAVNPEFWSDRKLTERQRFGAIKHELLHLAMMHPFRVADFSSPALYSVAADLVVNQYLTKEQLRPGQVLLEQLQGIRLESNRSLGYYYQQLETLLAQSTKEGKEDRETVQQWMSRDHPAQMRHEHWSDGLTDLQDEQKKALASAWQHQLNDLISKEAQGSFYRLDEALRELIRRSLAPANAVLDWKRVLRIFATNSRRMALKDTIRRPSKRYGTVPGIKIKRNQRLLVALDSSGSLPSLTLAEFFREIHQLWRAGAELTVIEIDDQIRNQYPYRGQKVLEVAGRGGTAFDPAIAFANAEGVDGLIYLTDGFGPVPEVAPRMPVLWLISKDGIRSDSRIWQLLPGRVVRLVPAGK